MFGVCPTRPEYGAFHPRVKLEYESKRECSKQVRSPAARKTSNGVNDLSHMEITLPSRITPYSSGSRPVSIFRTSSISSFSSTTSSPTSSPGCPSSPDIDMYINIPSRCRTSSTQHASGVTVDQDMVADLYDNANRSCVNTPLIDIRGRTAARFSDTVHLRHCIRDTDIRTQRTTLKGRKQSSYPNTGRAREQFTLRLNDIVPAQYLRMCAFLGFSSSGRLLISYSREIKDVQSWEERYKYELQLWRFSEARPLRLLERIPLFGGEHVTMEKIFIPLDECDPVLTVYALEKGQCVVATQIVMDDMETQALVVTDICLNSLDEEWSLFTPGAIETIPRGLLVNTESAYYILHWALNHANEAPLPTHSCNGAHVKGHEYSETEVSPSNDLHSHTRLSTDTLMRTHYNDSRDGDRNSSAREWGWVRKVRFHKSLPNAEVASYRLDIEALLQKSLTVHTCQGWKTTTHCKHNHDQPNGVSEYTKIDPNHSSTMVDRWLHASVDDGIRDLNRKRNTTSKAYTTKGDQDVDDLVDMPVRAHTTHPSIRKQTVMDTNAQPFIHSLQETLAAVPLLYNRASRLVKPHQYLHNNNVCVLRKSLRVLDHPYWPVRIELVD
eukprot:CFRG5790T1